MMRPADGSDFAFSGLRFAPFAGSGCRAEAGPCVDVAATAGTGVPPRTRATVRIAMTCFIADAPFREETGEHHPRCGCSPDWALLVVDHRRPGDQLDLALSEHTGVDPDLIQIAGEVVAIARPGDLRPADLHTAVDGAVPGGESRCGG